MTQAQAVQAYGTLMKIGGKVTGADAFALFRLRKQLREVVEFQVEEEQKLVDKYGGKVENGRILIPDVEKRAAFIAEHDALGAMACDVEPVEAGTEGITMDEIEVLDGFVTWRE